MQRLIWTVVVAFFGMLALGPVLIPMLVRKKFGQQERDNIPETHRKKQGTPTMGGLLYWVVIGAAALIFKPVETGWLDMVVMVAAMLGFGVIGFLDDWLKISRKNTDGLAPRYKVVGQVAVSLALALYCYFNPRIGSSIIIPFFGIEWELGVFYVPLMVFAGVSTTNSANVTDGVDGLLSGVTLIIMAAFALLAMFAWQAGGVALASQDVMIFAGAAAGACLGFLRFNAYPARLIMGDTGSFALGGAVLASAMMLRLPLLIIVLGAMYIVSTMTVMIQRFYYRKTGGKRIWKSSPFHHHLELSGYSETQIVALYMMITAVLALVSMLALQ